MKKAAIIAVMLGGLMFAATMNAQEQGRQVFEQTCIACHTIGGGRLVGPDLANVDQRRSEAWILKFVKSPITVINSGDKDAAALFEEYGRLPMPDNNLSDEQIRSIIAYIAANSPGREAPKEIVQADTGAATGAHPADTQATAAAPPPVPTIGGRLLSEATDANARSGGRLFAGYVRFTNGGPSCISCHNVDNGSIISGGGLAKDLTAAFTRLNGNGVASILTSLPFPAMKHAYENAPLTEEEMFNVVAFLQHTAQIKDRPATSYGPRLMLAGFGGAAVMVLLLSGIWFRRRRGSVNRRIYERQIKSTQS